MECLQALSLVSQAIDREPLDAAALAEAKEHCRSCPDCSAFVRAQLAMKNTPLPTPPADLADRVMDAVRAEAASMRVAAEQAAATQAAKPPKPEAEEVAVSLAPPKPRARRSLPRPLVIGLASAAMLVAVLGVGALVIFGARQMSSAPPGTLSTTAHSEAEAPTYDYLAPAAPSTGGRTGSIAGPPTASSSAGSAIGGKATLQAAAQGPQDITVNGVVYSLAGQTTTSLESMQVIASTNTSLDTTKAATSRQVYAGQSPDTVYLTDDSKNVLSFSRATRQYLGLTFVLTSAELTAFGQWPSLPAQFPTPSTSDGQPTFTYDGTDASGVSVYRSATAPATEGIAVAPKSDSSGSAAGDPNWTWWAIQR